MANKKRRSSEGLINHYGAVRIRAVGSGNLQMTLFSLDDINSSLLIAFPLSATTNKEPTRLANFTEQRAALEIKVTEINEWFRIDRIVIFSKPVASSFPG
jgi:hypothetical protein